MDNKLLNCKKCNHDKSYHKPRKLESGEIITVCTHQHPEYYTDECYCDGIESPPKLIQVSKDYLRDRIFSGVDEEAEELLPFFRDLDYKQA